jgi:hypothetical protein
MSQLAQTWARPNGRAWRRNHPWSLRAPNSATAVLSKHPEGWYGVGIVHVPLPVAVMMRVALDRDVIRL